MSTSTKQLVWLITGTSTGIGRDLTLAALKRGEKVIATARDISKINDLKEAGADILQLDVTDPLDKLHVIAKEAVQIHGRVDVLVNNAAYVDFAALEEDTPEETFKQYKLRLIFETHCIVHNMLRRFRISTNIFGALNTTRAVLPFMRSQRSGTIVWIGSVGGWGGTLGCGLYVSTKFAIRGLSETLHMEIEPLGLKSICFEPGYFRTALLEAGHLGAYNPRIADYNKILKKQYDDFEAYNGRQPGDPKKLAQVFLDVVRQEGVAKGRETPLALPLGSDCLKGVQDTLNRTSNVLTEWEDVIKGTDFPDGN